MKIFIASDHQGHNLRKQIIKSLEEYEFVSSTLEEKPDDDYPLFAFDVCEKMDKKEDYAILICGTGIGISIAANKVKGIRCARVTNINDVIMSKKHNHANAIAFSADTPLEEAISYIKSFIETEYDEEMRHTRRVQEIINYERGSYNEL